MEFDIRNGKVVVKPETLMIGELRAIWDADDSPNKPLANEILMYIHIAAQVDEIAPFFGAREDEVRQLAKDQVWFRRECPIQLSDVESALIIYRKSKEVGEMRILKIFNKKIDQLQDKIDTVEPEISTKTDRWGNFTGFATNMGMITKVMSELNPLLDEKDKLANRMKKQSEAEKSFRAGKKQNRLEKMLLTGQQHGTGTETTNVGGEA